MRHELQRRRRQELLRSLEEPHPDSFTTACLGLESWRQELPAGDDDLLDPRGGVRLHWSEEQGWRGVELQKRLGEDLQLLAVLSELQKPLRINGRRADRASSGIRRDARASQAEGATCCWP